MPMLDAHKKVETIIFTYLERFRHRFHPRLRTSRRLLPPSSSARRWATRSASAVSRGCPVPLSVMRPKALLANLTGLAAVLLILIAGSVVVASPARAALSGNRPLVVVLCKFTDQVAEPHNAAYYRDMFSESGAGQRGVFDFWRDVSYGRLDLTGTVVKGWYAADTTAAEFNVMSRPRQIDVCASKADPDVDFTRFAGVVVLTNHTNFQGP